MRNDLPVTIRPAGPSSRAALDALVERCSADTLYRRFHGTAAGPIRRELDRIATPTPDHRSWLAVSPADGEVHGTATLAWGRRGPEMAFVVEDAWRRRGVGRLLFSAVLDEAARRGEPQVDATVQADNERALRFVRAVAPQARSRFAGGAEVEVTVPVVPPPTPTRTPTQEGRVMRPILPARPDRSSALAGVAPFDRYGARALAPLGRHADRLRVREGTVLARTGRPVREVVQVLAGEVAVITPGGVERRGPGTWVGADPMLDGTAQPSTVVAGAGLEVLVLPAPAFRWATQVLPGLVAGVRGPSSGDGPGDRGAADAGTPSAAAA